MSNNLSILNRRNQYLIVNRRYLTSHIQNTIIQVDAYELKTIM